MVFGCTNKTTSTGRICLVIDDFGYAIDNTVQGFIDIDRNITFAIIPGAPYALQVSEMANFNRIETIIHMPMEPYDNTSKNWYMLHDELNEKEVDQKITMAYDLLPLSKGMNNHQGSKAMENLDLMKNVARSLKKLNLFFLDSFTNPESRGFITMRRYGVRTELRQVFLDHIETYEDIKANLDSLVLLSHTMDVAIGIGHVKPLTLEILKREIPALKDKGYDFVKLSEVVR